MFFFLLYHNPTSNPLGEPGDYCLMLFCVFGSTVTRQPRGAHSVWVTPAVLFGQNHLLSITTVPSWATVLGRRCLHEGLCIYLQYALSLDFRDTEDCSSLNSAISPSMSSWGIAAAFAQSLVDPNSMMSLMVRVEPLPEC